MAALAYTYDDPVPNDLVSIAQAAFDCKICTETIYKYIATGRLRCWGRPGRYRVSMAELMPTYQVVKANRPRASYDRSKNLGAHSEPRKAKTATAVPAQSPHTVCLCGDLIESRPCPHCGQYLCSTVVGSDSDSKQST